MILLKALITGASSGIGREIARLLAARGYELVIAARREDRLEELKKTLGVPCKIACIDLSVRTEAERLFEENRDVDILVNNAGFGVFGAFDETPLSRECEMLDVNILALHILMKLYLAEFKKRGSGRILNVSSSASFFPGPMFSSYYASKAYVTRLSLAVREELRREKSPVTVSVLCPGPVRTEFNDVAGVKFGIGSVSPQYAARAAVDGMFKGKGIITPSLATGFTRFISKLVPDSLAARVVYVLQKKKEK